MRADDQVVIARMNQKIVNPNGRQAGHERLPLRSPVQRNKEPVFGAYKQQILVLWIFADDVYVSVRWKIADHRDPGRAIIASNEHVGLHVIKAMTIDRQVTRARV